MMESTLEEDMRFIREELLPEMVHNRCFCESNSREFVELETINIESCTNHLYHLNFALYRAEIVIKFSGEPKTFYVLVKLLPENSVSTNDSSIALAYDGFSNEEIMCNKATLQYGKDLFPKLYVADMGRYNRPVIVIEDLERNGFERVLDRELNLEEAGLVANLIGRFHGKGLMLRETKFSTFREFYAKFKEIIFSELAEMDTEKNFLRLVNQLKSASFEAKGLSNFEKIFENNPYRACKDILLKSTCNDNSSTICQGLLLRENLWFKKINVEKMELKILDWQHVRYGSNSIDLATILTQSKTSLWKDLIEIYVNAVKQEQPVVSDQELRNGITNPGFFYAFIILSFQNHQPPQFFNILPHLPS